MSNIGCAFEKMFSHLDVILEMRKCEKKKKNQSYALMSLINGRLE